jgi:Lhr-like helicase
VTPIAGATVNPAAVVPPTAENFTQEVTPTPAVDPGVPISSSQMLPNSATEEISTSQLDNMTAEEIRIARNEIYARHGLIFQAEDLNEYFSAQDWYQGTVNDTDSITLSEIEAKNVAIIVAYEDAMDAD